MNDYLTEVKEVIAEKTGVEIEEISNDAYFEEDLNISELELIDIVTELEEKYQVELIDDMEEVTSVQELADLLVEKIE